MARENQLASALKDLEIELEQKRYEHNRAKLDVTIDPDIVSAKEWAERQLTFTRAERELAETRERVELTRNRGSADLDVLQINRDKLSKDLLIAQNELGRLSIRAPAAGLVVYENRSRSTLKFQEGDQSWPGQHVMSLPDLSKMRVEFDVNEVDAPALAVGMGVEVRLDAFPGRSLRGEIERIPSMAVKRDETSKIAVFKTWAELDETWVGEMKPGMSVQGRIVTSRELDLPLVRREAVRVEDGRFWIDVDQGASREIFPVDRNATHYRIEEQAWAALAGEGIATATAEAVSGSEDRT